MIMQIELEKITDYAQNVSVIKDGNATAFAVGSDRFNEICAEWNAMTGGAHEMPAFSVSLHRETVKEIKNGVWVEFGFSQAMEANGMPFEKLLVDVRPENCGFNIIRYTAEYGYDGRCFYYDLVGKNMSSFYNCVVK